MIAALYVQTKGIYSQLPGVDVWDEARDARSYTQTLRRTAGVHCPIDNLLTPTTRRPW